MFQCGVAQQGWRQQICSTRSVSAEAGIAETGGLPLSLVETASKEELLQEEKAFTHRGFTEHLLTDSTSWCV